MDNQITQLLIFVILIVLGLIYQELKRKRTDGGNGSVILSDNRTFNIKKGTTETVTNIETLNISQVSTKPVSMLTKEIAGKYNDYQASEDYNPRMLPNGDIPKLYITRKLEDQYHD